MVMSIMPHPRTRAFSLIELLVVVSIMTLLMAVLVPGMSKARRQAAATVCGSNLKQIAVAFAMYVSDPRDRYPAAQDPVRTAPFYWLWMGRGFRGFIGPYLVKDISASNPNALVCPGDRTDPGVYERTSYAYSMSFYHSPEQIDAMSTPADTYSNPQPPVAQSPTGVRRPGCKILAGEWASHHEPVRDKDQGWWDTRGRRTFLLADGHVMPHAARSIEPANDGLPDPNLTRHGVRGFDVR